MGIYCSKCGEMKEYKPTFDILPLGGFVLWSPTVKLRPTRSELKSQDFPPVEASGHQTLQWKIHHLYSLVGGLEHEFYFAMTIGNGIVIPTVTKTPSFFGVG